MILMNHLFPVALCFILFCVVKYSRSQRIILWIAMRRLRRYLFGKQISKDEELKKNDEEWKENDDVDDRHTDSDEECPPD